MDSKNSFRLNCYNPGSFLSIGSSVVTEIAARFPFTWLLLDMEHGGFCEANLMDNLRAISNANISVIVRVPAVDHNLIGKLLDSGAHGIMIPHVESVQQIEACKNAMYYPPQGKRGLSSSVRQYAYGTRFPKDISLEEKPLLFAQIESVEGVMQAEKIAAADGVDVLFIGPSDLQLALKCQTGNVMDFQAALEKVADAAISSNKKAGILLRDMMQVDAMLKCGYTCIAVDSDVSILRAGYTRVIDMFKKQKLL